ncbi:MAG: hypothetical protein MHM6MM_007723 [Cercozoa sp. M6MM]
MLEFLRLSKRALSKSLSVVSQVSEDVKISRLFLLTEEGDAEILDFLIQCDEEFFVLSTVCLGESFKMDWKAHISIDTQSSSEVRGLLIEESPVEDYENLSLNERRMVAHLQTFVSPRLRLWCEWEASDVPKERGSFSLYRVPAEHTADVHALIEEAGLTARPDYVVLNQDCL